MAEAQRKKWFMLVLIGAFITLLVMNSLTPLEADDYTYMYSFKTRQEVTSVSDFFVSAIAHHSHMNGRIVTNALFAQGMLLLGKGVFNVVNAGVYVLFLFGIYLLVRGKKRFDWALLVAIHASAILFIPVFGVTVLWLDGACNYLWGTTLMLYAIWPFRDAVVKETQPNMGVGKTALLALVALMAGNVTENTSMTIIILMVLCAVWTLIREKKIPIWMIIMTVMTIVGYVVLMTSGTRAGAVSSALHVGRYLSKIPLVMAKLLDYKGLLCTYALLLALAWGDAQARGRVTFSLGLFSCAMLANLAMLLPSYYPQRASFGWIVFLLVACGMLMPGLKRLLEGRLWRGLVLCLALMAAITLTQALPNVYDRYRQAEAREADIIAQREAGVQDVVTYGIKSKTSFDVYCDGSILSSDPRYRPNYYCAKYYGVGTISISEELN